MKLHDTQITNYLAFCKSQKCLDVKTIRAYKIDLTHFASTMSAETSLYDTPHMFRHTFASSLLDADVDIRYIQEMLGHSSITTTQIYTHVTLAKQKMILTTKHPRNGFCI